jgi:hypothetical protein
MPDVNTDCAGYTAEVLSKIEEPQQKGHCPEIAGRYLEGAGMYK